MSIGRALMAVHHQLLQTIRDIPLPLPTGRYCLLYYSAGRRKPSFWPTTAQSIKDCSTTNNEKPQWPYFELPASSQELFSYDSPFSSVQFSRSIVSNSLQPCGPQPARVLSPWDSSGKNTRTGAISSSRGSSRLRDRTHVSCFGRWVPYDHQCLGSRSSCSQFQNPCCT